MNTKRIDIQGHLPSVEVIQRELATAESIDDFFGKEGIFSPAVCGYSGGNARSRTHRTAWVRTLRSERAQFRQQPQQQAPKKVTHLRWRRLDSSPPGPQWRVLASASGKAPEQQQRNRRERIITLYAKGVSTRDNQATLHELRRSSARSGQCLSKTGPVS